ncbi:MAG: inositol monophosphatase family protein [Atopostipes suicloacalis]|nr:inositol monophosphatase family protein [Atopostipes suicloacalis]
MTIIKERDRLIKKWLSEAAKEVRNSLEEDLEVQTKSRRNDLVTYMDKKIEKELTQKIKQHFPNDKIVSEEGYGDDIQSIKREEDTVWYLDPIDGTLNFVLQNERFAIMVAVYEKNIGQQSYILDVMRDELYWTLKDQGVFRNKEKLKQLKNTPLADGLFASNSMFISKEQVELNAEITKKAMGVRTIGSAAMEVKELLKGNTVAYLSYGLKAWDIAAGYMMIKELGGTVQRLDGSPIDFLKPAPSIIGTVQATADIQNLI